MVPLALAPKEPPGTLRLPAARKGRLGDGGCHGTASGAGWVIGPPQETRLQRDRRCRRGMEPEKERKRDRERVRERKNEVDVFEDRTTFAFLILIE